MYACKYCGKGHKRLATLVECKKRVVRREVLAQKKKEDEERRAAHAEAEPVRAYIRRRRREGATWVKVAKELRNDYPKPGAEDLAEFPWKGKYTWEVCLSIDAQRLNWPESPEAVAKLLPPGTMLVSEFLARAGQRPQSLGEEHNDVDDDR